MFTVDVKQQYNNNNNNWTRNILISTYLLSYRGSFDFGPDYQNSVFNIRVWGLLQNFRGLAQDLGVMGD